MTNTLRIATRKSPLALWQAHHVRQALVNYHPDLQVELVEMTTQGDKILDTPLAKIGGKGLFVKELEQGMLDGRADIAVHSMKDVPVDFPDGLQLTVIMEREQPFDAFVSNDYANFDELPEGAIVGTSSLRRQTQLLALRPDLHIKTLRGNVGTRLSKLDQGEYAAIILAAAGLKRLELPERIRSKLTAEQMLPAIGQGAVGIESRCDDERIDQILKPLNDPTTWLCVHAERAINQRLGGSCQVPIGGYATYHNGELSLRGLVGDLRGQTVLKAQASKSVTLDNVEHAEHLGLGVAEDLLQQGAHKLLAELEQE